MDVLRTHGTSTPHKRLDSRASRPTNVAAHPAWAAYSTNGVSVAFSSESSPGERSAAVKRFEVIVVDSFINFSPSLIEYHSFLVEGTWKSIPSSRRAPVCDTFPHGRKQLLRRQLVITCSPTVALLQSRARPYPGSLARSCETRAPPYRRCGASLPCFAPPSIKIAINLVIDFLHCESKSRC